MCVCVCVFLFLFFWSPLDTTKRRVFQEDQPISVRPCFSKPGAWVTIRQRMGLDSRRGLGQVDAAHLVFGDVLHRLFLAAVVLFYPFGGFSVAGACLDGCAKILLRGCDDASDPDLSAHQARWGSYCDARASAPLNALARQF